MTFKLWILLYFALGVAHVLIAFILGARPFRAASMVLFWPTLEAAVFVSMLMQSNQVYDDWLSFMQEEE